MGYQKIYRARKIFTGDDWISDHTIIVENGIIKDIAPSSAISGQYTGEFNDCIIAPAFIDVQIYGAYGKLFSEYPGIESLYLLNKHCNNGGTAFCLPTVATNSFKVYFECIDAVRNYWHQGGDGIIGLHIEGPWINPLKKGAHAEAFINTPIKQHVKELLDYGKNVIRIITMAPEVCSAEIIDLIRSYNVIISAGHSNATYKEAITGFDTGIEAVTHLYNAMSSLHHREPGLTGAAFNDDRVMVSIIPDGYHTDYIAIKIAKKIIGKRLFVITDAVTETLTGLYRHQFSDNCYLANGTLSGSALTMNKALQNLILYVNIDLSEALRMCSLYPATLLSMDNQLGRIKIGYRAKMVVLNNDLDLHTILL